MSDLAQQFPVAELRPHPIPSHSFVSISKGVRDWLGHANITNTALYLHVTDERKKQGSRLLNGL